MPEIEIPVEVQQDGDTVETTASVDTDDLDGVLHESELDDRFSDELQRRVSEATDGLVEPSSLREDEDFAREVATDHPDAVLDALGVDPDDDGGPDVEAIREEVRNQEVAPIEERNEELQKRVRQLRRDRRAREVAEAANEFGVRSSMIEPLRALMEQQTEWNEDHQQFVVLNENGEPKVSTSDDGGPYRTIREEIEARYRSGDYSDWFEESSRPGIGIEEPGGGTGRSGRVSLEEFEEMSGEERRELKNSNPDRWRELQDQRRQQGEAALGIA